MKEWFPHDYNAASDAKVRSLIRRHGATGYGLYWHLVEIMHTEQSLPKAVAIDALVIGTNEDEETVLSFLATMEALQLVSKDANDVYTIPRVTRNLSDRKDISERRAKAAGKRWRSEDKKPKIDAIAMQMQSKCNASAMLIQDITLHNNTDKKETTSLVLSANASTQTIAMLTTNTGQPFPITAEQFNRWTELYPAVDVRQSLRNMAGWLESNPTRRKTSRGMLKFANQWLQREQDRGNNGHHTTPTKRTTGDRVMGSGDPFGYAAEIIAERNLRDQFALPAAMDDRRLVAAEVRAED